MAADTSHAHSIITQKTDMDKILVLDDSKLLNCVELDAGDRAVFMDYVQKNMHLHEYRTGTRLNTPATAAWIRRSLADYLRSRTPFRVNLLLGGVDPSGTRTKEREREREDELFFFFAHSSSPASLYYMDYLASANPVDYAAQGYAGYMAPAVLDKYWKPDMTLAEGMDVLNKVIAQLKTRLVFSQPTFLIKVVTKDGIQVSEHKG